MDLIIYGYGVMSGCNHRKRPPVNRASQVTLRDLEIAVTGTVSGSCDLQPALFTTERQRELRAEVAFSKTCLKHSSA